MSELLTEVQVDEQSSAWAYHNTPVSEAFVRTIASYWYSPRQPELCRMATGFRLSEVNLAELKAEFEHERNLMLASDQYMILERTQFEQDFDAVCAWIDTYPSGE